MVWLKRLPRSPILDGNKATVPNVLCALSEARTLNEKEERGWNQWSVGVCVHADSGTYGTAFVVFKRAFGNPYWQHMRRTELGRHHAEGK